MRPRRLVPYLALAAALLLLVAAAAALVRRRASPAAEAFTATCPLAADRGDMANRFAEYDPLNEWSNADFRRWVVDPVLATLGAKGASPLPCPPVARGRHAPGTTPEQRKARAMAAYDVSLDPVDDRTGAYHTVNDVLGRYDPYKSVAASTASEANDYTTGDGTLRYATVAAQASTAEVELLPDDQRLPLALERVRQRIPKLVRKAARAHDRYPGIPPFERLHSCVVRVCRPPNARTHHYVWRDTYLRKRRSHDFQVEWTAAYTPTTRAVQLLGADIVGNEAGDVQLAAPHSAVTDRTDLTGFDAAFTPGYNRLVASPDALKVDLTDRYATYLEGLRAKDFRCVDQPRYLLDEERCKAPIDEYGRAKPPGIWDAPCQLDTDCPFYEANRNYPNQRGGCRRDGTCEMPVNVNRRGFRLYERGDTAHCHNCELQATGDGKGATDHRAVNHRCVAVQAQRRPPFERLASPDYAFVHDRRARVQHRAEIEARGLHV
jgi:hypothetical protein